MSTKDNTTAIARNRQYDIPLSRDESAGFLMLLIGLMTFLAMMAIAAAFIFGAMGTRWASGLENKMTIEIPAEAPDKKIREPAEIKAITDKISVLLKDKPGIVSFAIMERAEIGKMLEPWLGKDTLMETMPLPGLISVETNDMSPENIIALSDELQKIEPDISVDAHQEWLGNILRLANTLQFAAMGIALVIGITTVAAVAGGAHARMAIYAKDVELLHLMGASDSYITRQFQKHSLSLGLRGALAGGFLSFVALAAIAYFTNGLADTLLPEFKLSPMAFMILIGIPMIACALSGLTARITVMRALSKMP